MDPERVPLEVRSLIPMAEKYGIGDDFYREEVIQGLDNGELSELARCLDIEGDALDRWLCGEEMRKPVPSQEYCTMTNLVMAQQSASVKLKKRQ